MASSGSPDYRARRRQRAEQRRQQSEGGQIKEARSPARATRVDDRERRRAATTCLWCGGPITPKSRGPIPKWCSATCRHRAWEQARAAAFGHAAVQVIERPVAVPTRMPLTRRDWPEALHDLVRQLDDGRIYDRDLLDLLAALDAVLEAYRRHPYVRSGAVEDQRRARAWRQARRGGLT